MPIFEEPGGGQFDFVQSYDPATANYAVNTVTQNTVSLMLVRVARPVTVTKIRVWIGTANGNIDVGVYTSADGSTFTRRASAGSTASAGTNAIQELTLTAAFTFVPGTDHWLAWGTDSATVTTARQNPVVNGINGDGNRSISKASAWSSGLPLSLSSMSAGGAMIWMRAIP